MKRGYCGGQRALIPRDSHIRTQAQDLQSQGESLNAFSAGSVGRGHAYSAQDPFDHIDANGYPTATDRSMLEDLARARDEAAKVDEAKAGLRNGGGLEQTPGPNGDVLNDSADERYKLSLKVPKNEHGGYVGPMPNGPASLDNLKTAEGGRSSRSAPNGRSQGGSVLGARSRRSRARVTRGSLPRGPVRGTKYLALGAAAATLAIFGLLFEHTMHKEAIAVANADAVRAFWTPEHKFAGPEVKNAPGLVAE